MPGKEITDSELRRKLKELGQDVGPITDSTRKVYEKQLDKLLNGKAEESKKNRRRSAPLHPVHKTTSPQPSLIAFSSGESDLEGSDSDTRRRRRRTLPPSQLHYSQFNSSEHESLPSTSRQSSQFKAPLPKPSKSVGDKLNSSKLSGELKRSSLRSSKRLTLSNTSYELDTSDSDFDVDKRLSGTKSRKSLGEQFLPRLPSSDAFDASYTPSPLSLNLKNRSNVKTPSITSTSGKVALQVNGQRSQSEDRDESLDWEYRGDEDSDSTRWQHVPHLLLAVVAAFFAIVGLLYLGLRQNDPRSSDLATKGFKDSVCKGFGMENCVPKENFELALLATRHLHGILSERAGMFECEPNKYPTKSLTFDEAKRALFNVRDIKDETLVQTVFESCIFLMRKYKDWGLIILEDENGEGFALESLTARKGLWCRLEQAFQRVFKQLCLALAVIMGAYGFFLFVNHRRQKKRIFEKQLFELVEKIVETLQENAGLEKDSFLPVVHVRDMLIPLAERNNKGALHLWESAVKFLEENESRIRAENQRLAGEDFLVWRWLQPASPYPSSSSSSTTIGNNETRRTKVWQGQAFGTSGKGGNVLPFCPTPCLKIRNMFDPDVEFGNDWPHYIRDAILEKCEGNNGVLHIHVDSSSKEGCVFVKCITPESAGQLYRALHGWWFDGNLVTVKYLRLERYHERFPDARASVSPLKPSNNLRLSLRPQL